MRAFLPLPISILAAVSAFAQDPVVILATARDGRIQFFDASLNPIGGISVHQPMESVTPSPDGRRLYVARENGSGACCTLFALDLATKKMCQFADPARFGVPSPDGRFVFTQGRRGVDVFDAVNLGSLGTMAAPGAYNLQASADGRWLMGVTNLPKPSLDIFDIKSGGLDRRLPVPSGPATGAWAGERFYVFSYGEPGEGKLWSVKPEEHGLTPEKSIPLPDIHGECDQPVLLTLTGAHGSLYLAEAFGFRVDRRHACPDAAGGGIYRYDPLSGRLVHLAPDVHVHRMAVSPDGRDLYVVDAGDYNSRLMRIDIGTGHILHYTSLENSDWNLSLVRMPAALIPNRNVHVGISCAR